jgi:hypothetical protein
MYLLIEDFFRRQITSLLVILIVYFGREGEVIMMTNRKDLILLSLAHSV